MRRNPAPHCSFGMHALFHLIVASALFGCGGTAEIPAQKADKAPSSERSEPKVDLSTPPKRAADAADALFDFDHVPTFSLDLPAERWAELILNARDEVYAEANLEFEGRRIGTVGVRFKGDYGSLFSCFDEAGNLICPKLSMKLHFNEYDPTLRFYGLKHLNFNAYRYDDSKLREVVGYSLYREMGVVAPRASWANILVNGESFGLFGMVEQIDGTFADNRWPGNGNGNLYKEVWPNTERPSAYDQGLQTNSAAVDHRAVLAMASELIASHGADKSVVAGALGKWMSLEYLRRYIVVDESIMNADGFTSIYTNPEAGWTHNHNYYFYQEEKRDRFWLVPWDLDGTFWVQNGKLNVPSWTETPADCSVVYSVFDGAATAKAPGCDPIFQAIAADMAEVSELANQLLDGPFAVDRMNAKIDVYAAFIASSVAADPKLDPSTKVAYFESNVSELKRAIPILADRLRAIAQGVAIKPLAVPTAGLLDFESSTNIDARVNVVASTNAASAAIVSIENDAGGGNALHCGFEMRDESKPWSQWVSFAIPVADAPANLADRRGVRLKLKASRPGTARLEFAGKVNWDRHIYDYEGWSVNVTTEWTAHDFWFSDAVLPHWYVTDPANPAPNLQEILSTLVQLRILVDCMGRNSNGQMGSTTSNGTPRSDAGSVEVDDLQFLI